MPTPTSCQPNLGQEQVIRDSVSLGVSMSVVRRLKAESIGLKKMEAWPPVTCAMRVTYMGPWYGWKIL